MVEAMPNIYNRIKARKFSTTADTAVEISPSSSATPNFTIDAGGKLNWSSGSATADTNLYRSAANVLKTDDSFNIATGQTYKIEGVDVLTATSLGSTVVSSSLTSVGSLTGLTAATPTFSGPLTSSGTSTFSGSLVSSGGFTGATPSFSGPLTSSGVSTFQNTVVLQQSKEKFTVDSSSAINSTATNVDVLSGAVYYYTGTITDGFKFNIRGNSSTTLASLLTTNTEAITVVLMIENVSTAKSFAATGYLTIDTSATVTIKWFGGSKPSGNVGTDVYTFTIYKTGASAFTVFASQSKFA
jgi:hypothetical protein